MKHCFLCWGNWKYERQRKKESILANNKFLSRKKKSGTKPGKRCRTWFRTSASKLCSAGALTSWKKIGEKGIFWANNARKLFNKCLNAIATLCTKLLYPFMSPKYFFVRRIKCQLWFLTIFSDSATGKMGTVDTRNSIHSFEMAALFAPSRLTSEILKLRYPKSCRIKPTALFRLRSRGLPTPSQAISY